MTGPAASAIYSPVPMPPLPNAVLCLVFMPTLICGLAESFLVIDFWTLLKLKNSGSDFESFT